MSEKIEADGGPAFPTEKVVNLGSGASRTERSGGMSLRDYFAAQALAALLASPLTTSRAHEENPPGTMPTVMAHSAYMYADAMLKARSEVQP